MQIVTFQCINTADGFLVQVLIYIRFDMTPRLIGFTTVVLCELIYFLLPDSMCILANGLQGFFHLLTYQSYFIFHMILDFYSCEIWSWISFLINFPLTHTKRLTSKTNYFQIKNL